MIENMSGMCYRHRCHFVQTESFDNKCPACYWETKATFAGIENPKADNPSFDGNGYPTDETLKTISSWSYKDGFIELANYASKAWHWDDMATKREIMLPDGRKLIEYTFITGGWSGNEDIICAMKNNAVFHAICWRESHRGGKHVYEVPSK